MLEGDVSRIELEQGVTLHRLSQQEIVDISSHDVLDQPRVDVVRSRISSALTMVSAVGFHLTKEAPKLQGESSLQAKQMRVLGHAIQAMHILKDGHANMAATYTRFAPEAFPHIRRGSMHPLFTSPFGHLSVGSNDVERLRMLYKTLSTSGDDIKLAASRLVDAAGRISAVDALLDAVIGIECLLNQRNATELSFRVALNYAFLAPPRDRRSRFDEMRAIYDSRSKIVHTGTTGKSRQSANIAEHATSAKACLRNILHDFLTDPMLAGEKKDTEFWLQRIMPCDAN